MPSELAPFAHNLPVATAQNSDYSDILARLGHLSRDLLLAFRLEVGHLMLQRFYAGDLHAYQSHAADKDASFAAFARTCKAELADYGLNLQTLRRCINARAVYDLLPPSTRDDMQFMHVVELSRVKDATARARLAMDVKLGAWSVGQLKDAIGQYQNGTYYDTEPLIPGTQPPAPRPEPAKHTAPGRLVNQLHKTAQDLDAWHAEWQQAQTSHLRKVQRERYGQAVAALKAKIDLLAAELAGDGE